jgi:hypothetical protein
MLFSMSFSGRGFPRGFFERGLFGGFNVAGAAFLSAAGGLTCGDHG